jgi:hypothetical protein
MILTLKALLEALREDRVGADNVKENDPILILEALLVEDRVETDDTGKVDSDLESIAEALGEHRVEADDVKEVEPVIQRHVVHVSHLGHLSSILTGK